MQGEDVTLRWKKEPPDQRARRWRGSNPPPRPDRPGRVPARAAIANPATGGSRATTAGAATAGRPVAQAPRKRGAFSRFARFVMALVALALIAAAVAPP